MKLKDVEPIIERLNGVCLQDDLYGMGIQKGIEIAIEFINETPTIHPLDAARRWAHGIDEIEDI